MQGVEATIKHVIVAELAGANVAVEFSDLLQLLIVLFLIILRLQPGAPLCLYHVYLLGLCLRCKASEHALSYDHVIFAGSPQVRVHVFLSVHFLEFIKLRRLPLAEWLVASRAHLRRRRLLLNTGGRLHFFHESDLIIFIHSQLAF